jgi:hypothetical protein
MNKMHARLTFWLVLASMPNASISAQDSLKDTSVAEAVRGLARGDADLLSWRDWLLNQPRDSVMSYLVDELDADTLFKSGSAIQVAYEVLAGLEAVDSEKGLRIILEGLESEYNRHYSFRALRHPAPFLKIPAAESLSTWLTQNWDNPEVEELHKTEGLQVLGAIGEGGLATIKLLRQVINDRSENQQRRQTAAESLIRIVGMERFPDEFHAHDRMDVSIALNTFLAIIASENWPAESRIRGWAVIDTMVTRFLSLEDRRIRQGTFRWLKMAIGGVTGPDGPEREYFESWWQTKLEALSSATVSEDVRQQARATLDSLRGLEDSPGE